MITIATPTHKAAAVLSAMFETNGIVSPNVKVTTIHKALEASAASGGGTMKFSAPKRIFTVY